MISGDCFWGGKPQCMVDIEKELGVKLDVFRLENRVNDLSQRLSEKMDEVCFNSVCIAFAGMILTFAGAIAYVAIKSS